MGMCVHMYSYTNNISQVSLGQIIVLSEERGEKKGNSFVTETPCKMCFGYRQFPGKKTLHLVFNTLTRNALSSDSINQNLCLPGPCVYQQYNDN